MIEKEVKLLCELDLLIEALIELKNIPESNMDKESCVRFDVENQIVSITRYLNYNYVEDDLKASPKEVVTISVMSLFKGEE